MQSPERVRLTPLCSGGGCASKIGSADLAVVLRDLPASLDPRVLVGFGTSDDAGVFKLREDLAIVQTVDFFPPIVDDPYDFGRIAAANAVSDIYAMGGTPISALNIVAFPLESLGPAILARILAGGAEIAREAGFSILGGHTIEDDEPKYGMAVTGTIDPRKIVTNAGARPGDVLVLTKPIGTGILASALKKDALGEKDLETAVRWMTKLNAGAARAMLAAGAHAATDVTGFGVLGHGGEMMRASGVRLRISARNVPVHALVRDMLAVGIVPAGTRRNAKHHEQFTEFAHELSGDTRLILSDAQTSGGLLIALSPEKLPILREALLADGALCAEIGTVEHGTGIAVGI
jgi:selenide,water dikinase